jgi:hypothetical protein
VEYKTGCAGAYCCDCPDNLESNQGFTPDKYYYYKGELYENEETPVCPKYSKEVCSESACEQACKDIQKTDCQFSTSDSKEYSPGCTVDGQQFVWREGAQDREKVVDARYVCQKKQSTDEQARLAARRPVCVKHDNEVWAMCGDRAQTKLAIWPSTWGNVDSCNYSYGNVNGARKDIKCTDL